MIIRKIVFSSGPTAFVVSLRLQTMWFTHTLHLDKSRGLNSMGDMAIGDESEMNELKKNVSDDGWEVAEEGLHKL